MTEKLLGWLLTYIKDGKRLTAAFLALFNLVYPKLQAFADFHGVQLPVLDPGSTAAGASWLAVAVLNLWSKANAVQAAKPTP